MEALRRELLNSSDMQEEFNKYEADPRREEWLKDYSEGKRKEIGDRWLDHWIVTGSTMSLLDYVYRSGFVSRPSKRLFPTSHPPGETATASVKATLTTIEPALSANGSEQSDQPDEELQQNDNPHQGYPLVVCSLARVGIRGFGLPK